MESTENKYFVYALLDPRKEGNFVFDDYSFKYKPFYIGKGHGNRPNYHLKLYKKDSNKKKINKIKSILNSKKEPIISKIYVELFENDAYEKEKFVINTIGLEQLTNICEGGKGRDSNSLLGKKNPMFGLKRPKWLIEKMQKERAKTNGKNKGKNLEEIYGVEKAKEIRIKLSNSRKGKSWEEYFGVEKAKEVREKRSKERKDIIVSNETRKKLSIIANNEQIKEKKRVGLLKYRENIFNEIFSEYNKKIEELINLGYKKHEIYNRLSNNLSRYMTYKIYNKILNEKL